VSGEENGSSALGLCSNQIDEGATGYDIDPGRGLIQIEQVGPGKQSCREFDPLLLSAGETTICCSTSGVNPDGLK
jgi:hypothetical protein